MSDRYLVRTATSPLFVVGVGLSVFAGVMIAVLQIYWWVRTGEWLPLPVAAAVRYAGIDPAGVISTVGSGRIGGLVGRVLQVPISLGVGALGAAAFAAAAALSTAVRRT